MADDIIVLQVEKDFDSVIETVFKTELVTVISENFEIITGQKLRVIFSDIISYEVKKTRWQSGGINSLKFVPGPNSKIMTYKNAGKETTIFVPSGLPKSTRPQKKINRDQKKTSNNAHVQLRSPTPYAPNVQTHRLSAAANAANQRVRATEKVPMATMVSLDNLTIAEKNGISGSTTFTNFNSGSQENFAAAAKKKKPPPPPPKKLQQAKALYV